MVGVPGRSKACVTCRKRKKGCDLNPQGCGQCKERGITCGGYDSDRIFIYHGGRYNRTTALQSSRDATMARPSTSPFPQGMHMVPIGSQDQGRRTSTYPRPISVMLSQSLMRSAYSEQSINAFIQMYIPGGDTRDTSAESRDFVGMLPFLSIRDEALQMAVLAIGTAALAKSTGDESLKRQGRSLYGKALKEMAVALRSSTRARSEALLAVPRVMALFEILFGAEANPTAQAKNWLSHTEGETALIVSRGPEAYAENDQAHLLFVNARFRPLIASVRTRKASILNHEDWKTLPWKNRIKTANDRLLDVLCGVPELLEAVDKINSLTLSERRTERLRVQTVAKCWKLHFQLQEWLTTYPNEVYIPTAMHSTAPISFPDLETACLTSRYWVTALLLYSSLDIATGILPTTDASISHADRPHPRQFARFIARSVSYFFQEKYGVTGATALSFPLGNTLFYFKRNPEPDRQYMGMIMKAWSNPSLPSAIRDFLASLRQSVVLPTYKAKSMSEL